MNTLVALMVAQVLAVSGPAPATAAQAKAPPSGRWAAPVKVTGTLEGKTATAPLLVYLPAGYAAKGESRKHPLVVALHGWNHSPELFRDKAGLSRWADRYGVVLAIPAMGKSIYETRLYPESKRAWAAVPGTRWVGEVILPYLRAHYAVSAERSQTAVIGYSTGGRGAVLLAEAYPEFAFAGSLSGTFDLMRLDPQDGEYKIHAHVYGARDQFQERWNLDNCISPERLAKLAGTRLFIGHGERDKVVRRDQLDALRDALGANPAVQAEFVIAPDGGHDWAYWNGQWGALFQAMGTALGLTAAP
ncbi:MAG TPA: alpha/beta hydrolase-fold protein [Myxococcaceae bacterium]|nr:alpha/beta hydrolase-fold protein [Myxococcaceae bacterium]